MSKSIKVLKSEFEVSEIGIVVNDGSAWRENTLMMNTHAKHSGLTVIVVNGRNLACFRGDVAVVEDNKIVDIIPAEEFNGGNYIILNDV